MKHAWEFILDDDMIMAPDNLAIVAEINRLIEEGFYYNAGKLRDVPVNNPMYPPQTPIRLYSGTDLAVVRPTLFVRHFAS